MKIQSLDIPLRALSLLPLLALAACDPTLQLGELFDKDLEASDTQTTSGQTDPDEPSTGATDPSSTSTDPSSTSTDPSSTSTDPSEEATTQASEEPVECDPWAQDCPAGQKCAPYADNGDAVWSALKCVDIDPAPVPVGSSCLHPGSVADPSDNCEGGSFCWDVDPDTNIGTCVAQCEGTPEAAICAAGYSCNIFNDGVLTLCLADCDPLGQDCGEDETCVSAGDIWSCVNDASADEGQAFDPCEYVNSCDPGLACMSPSQASECDPDADGCCLPLCDVSAPNTCPGVGLVCSPLYEGAVAPPGLENLGLCRIPD